MSDQPQMSPQTQHQRISPFKNVEEFENELKQFANKYRTKLSEHSRRISDYFEMSCYNMIVRYYEHCGYIATVENLQARRFRFKCSPSGLLENFSYMKLRKGETTCRIYHNASVQSAHDIEVYTTPDIVIASDTIPIVTTDYYKTKKRFSYLPNKEMVTFCEAKHHTPFSELMINFIGTVNELRPTSLDETTEENIYTEHIAPTLMMSGSLNKPAERVAKSLQKRYFVNILDDLFIEPYKTTFSKSGIDSLATLAKKRSSEEINLNYN